MKLYELNLDAAKQQTITGIEKLSQYLVPLGTNSRSKKQNYVIDINDRFTVVWELSGKHLPFYFSTGQGRKEKVAADKWYPFFGLTSDWINKGSQEDLNNYYGSSNAKRIAQNLNKWLPNPAREVNHVLWKPVTVSDHASAIKIINKDFTPVSKNDSKENIDKALWHGFKVFGGKPLAHN